MKRLLQLILTFFILFASKLQADESIIQDIRENYYELKNNWESLHTYHTSWGDYDVAVNSISVLPSNSSHYCITIKEHDIQYEFFVRDLYLYFTYSNASGNENRYYFNKQGDVIKWISIDKVDVKGNFDKARDRLIDKLSFYKRKSIEIDDNNSNRFISEINLLSSISDFPEENLLEEENKTALTNNSFNIAEEGSELKQMLNDLSPLLKIIGGGIICILFVLVLWYFGLLKGPLDRRQEKFQNLILFGNEDGPPEGWRSSADEKALKLNIRDHEDLSDKELAKEIQKKISDYEKDNRFEHCSDCDLYIDISKLSTKEIVEIKEENRNLDGSPDMRHTSHGFESTYLVFKCSSCKHEQSNLKLHSEFRILKTGGKRYI